SAAQGSAHLAAGRLEEALDALLEARSSALRQGLRHPTAVSWAADLVEVCVGLEHLDLAAEVAVELAEAADATASITASGLAARCEGLLSGARAFTEPFARAIDLHLRAGAPFDEARDRLNLGLRLRR